MKKMKKKKLKKIKPKKISKINKKIKEYTPVFVNTAHKESKQGFKIRVAIKILLVCLSATGLCMTLAQIYRIPISLLAVVLVCFTSVISLNVALMYFKKRALVIPLLAFLLIADSEVLVSDSMKFFSHLMHVLQSRLLTTARYAVYSVSELAQWENSRSVALVFMAVCILISLLFTLGARSRFIGIMLISTVFTTAPAFGAEIAGYVSGVNLLIAGMLGIYSMWVAHAWENAGGIHQINYDENGVPQKPGKPGKPGKTSEAKPREPIYKIMPGSPPHFYKYSRNSLTAAILALASVFIAASAVQTAVKFDYMVVVDAVRDIHIANMPDSVRRFFNRHFGRIDDGGLFPNPGIDNISMGITSNRPSTRSAPMIRVTLEDDSDKIFLRGGIGIDFVGDSWTTRQNSPEFTQLQQLLESGFLPELEYHTLWQMLRELESEAPVILSVDGVIRRQNVNVEYLARAGFALIPTHPRDPDAIRRRSDYDWYLDTVLRPVRRINSHRFDTLYLRIDNSGSLRNGLAHLEDRRFGYNSLLVHPVTGAQMTYDEAEHYVISIIGENPLLVWWNEWGRNNPGVEPPEPPQEVQDALEIWESESGRIFDTFGWELVTRDRFADMQWNFPCGTSAASWNRGIVEYRSLINAVYADIPASEAANIDALLRNIGFVVDAINPRADNPAFPYRESNRTPYRAVELIHNYLREYYAWSLSIDNTRGDNTPIGNFLFETRQGHCALYASAMTLAVRRLGIPARYVTGIVTVRDGGLVQEMAERDFHAWVEVYFENVGWVPFDPTGGARGNDGGQTDLPVPPPTGVITAPTTVPTSPHPTMPTSPTASGQPTSPGMTGVTSAPDDSGGTGVGGTSTPINYALLAKVVGLPLLAILLGAVVLAAFRRLKRAEEEKFARWKEYSDDSGASAEEMYQFMFRLLKSEGIEARSGESPLEFAERVDRRAEAAAESAQSESPLLKLSDVMPIFERLEFEEDALVVLTPEEYGAIYEYVTALYEKTVLSKNAAARVAGRVRFR
jgi:transglutaminase-like putative cysteine protease